MLIDAPAVLGWDRWREVGMKYGLGVIEAMLVQAIADGVIPDQPTRPTAHVLLGALDEAALYVSRAPDTRLSPCTDGRRLRPGDHRDRRRLSALPGTAGRMADYARGAVLDYARGAAERHQNRRG